MRFLMPTFNYFDDIPKAPNNPSSDQPNMQTNTNSIDGIINVDHFSFEQGGLDGYHKQCTIQEQGTYPSIPSTAHNGAGTLYTQGVPGSGGDLFYVYGSGPNGIRMTVNVPPVDSQNGVSFLPGGLIIQWGKYNAGEENFSSGSTTSSSTDQTVVTFPTPFPNNIFFLGGNLTYNSSNLPSGTGTLNIRESLLNSGSKSSFSWQVYCDTNNYIGFVWYAIGN